jgi:myo-inositol-1(or 4)-monophosphatase
MIDFDSLMSTATSAVDIASTIAKTHAPDVLRPKGDRDMVSDVDIQIERAVRTYLRQQAPAVSFLGEEEGSAGGISDLLWALDPIDGTANFVRQLPLYAISLALVQNNLPVLGIIDLPALGSRYSAIKGRGAKANDIKIHVHPTSHLHDAIVSIGDYAVGIAADTKNELRLAVTQYLAREALRVRMFGAAAIDLAWLAEGKTDAAIILANKPWDTAAGAVIAHEAGAQVLDIDGSSHSLTSKATIAVVPALRDEILGLLSDAQSFASARTGIT